MAKLDTLAFLDATAQAELVRRKEVTAIELVDAAIERIERLNPTINAVVTPMYEQAHATATGQLPQGPFAGYRRLARRSLYRRAIPAQGHICPLRRGSDDVGVCLFTRLHTRSRQ